MEQPELRLYTVDDVAERLQLSRATVYKHIESGKLQTLRVGQRRRVSPAQLARFIEDLESEGGAAPVWPNLHKRDTPARASGVEQVAKTGSHTERGVAS